MTSALSARSAVAYLRRTPSAGLLLVQLAGVSRLISLTVSRRDRT
jgi:hypothetical protein